jgi:hypothetical protein
LSISEGNARATDFDRWIAAEFGKTGAFTAFVVLVEISGNKVTPLCSTYFNVIGSDIDWAQLTALLAGAGQHWNGVAFFPHADSDGGLLDDASARSQLRELEKRLGDDRLVLNEGHFFDEWGRRMVIEEIDQG